MANKKNTFDARTERDGALAGIRAIMSNNIHRLKENKSVSHVLSQICAREKIDKTTVLPNQTLPAFTNEEKHNNTGSIIFTRNAINDLQKIYELYQQQVEYTNAHKKTLMDYKDNLTKRLVNLSNKKEKLLKLKESKKRFTTVETLELRSIQKAIKSTKTKLSQVEDNLKKLVPIKPFNYLCTGLLNLDPGNIYIDEITVPILDYYEGNYNLKLKKLDDDKPNLSEEEYNKRRKEIKSPLIEFFTSQNPDDLLTESLYLNFSTIDYFKLNSHSKTVKYPKIALVGTTADQTDFSGFTLYDLSKNIFRSDTTVADTVADIYTGAIHIGGLEKKIDSKKAFIPNNIESIVLPYTPQKSNLFAQKTFKLSPYAYNIKKAQAFNPNKNGELTDIPCNQADMPFLTNMDKFPI